MSRSPAPVSATARRAGHEPHAEPLLEPPDRVAERGLRHAKPGRGAGEIALLREREQVHEVAQILAAQRLGFSRIHESES
jgi:hypothetical protein